MKNAENGLEVKSWSDIVAVSTLLALFIGVLAWGLKLESRIDTVQAEVMVLRGQVGQGILPRAEERVRSLRKDLDEHERKHHGDK